MQRLADVDVAKPGHDLLIEKRRLDRAPAPLEALHKVILVKTVAQGLGAEPGKEAVVPERLRRPKIHHSEAAGIVEGDARAALGIDHHVIMPPRRLRGGAIEPRDHHPPRHPQMHDQGFAGIEIGKQVFRAPPEPQHAPAREPRPHLGREGPAQIGAAHIGMPDPRSFQNRQKPAAYGFDFGQFRHLDPFCSCGHCIAGPAPYKRG